jgi:hypothetical protein
MTTNNAPAARQAIVASGTFDNDSINEQLRLASERCHMISSATSVRLPPGCAVVCSVVQLGASDVYDVGGGRKALLRVALLKLANAAGICWDANASGRVVVHPRHPYLVSYRAQGAWRGLDGTWLPVVGDAMLDLRDGTAAVQKILESARPRVDDAGNVRVSAEEVGRVQLRDMRAKILEHCQSRAELRGIRKALAIRSYTLDELKRPWAVFKPVWIGSDSAEDRAAVRASFLGGVSALFGNRPAPRLAAAPAPAALPAHDFTADGEVLEEPDLPDDPPPHEEPAGHPAATDAPAARP